MICKNCGIEIKNENNKFCPNCGIEIERKQKSKEDLIIDNDIEYKEVAVSNNAQSKRVLIIAGIAILVLIIVINLIVSLSVNSPKKQMERALDTHDSYEVNSLYSEAHGDSSLTDKYDEAISEFLDEVISDLNSKVYSEDDLIENGYTVVSRDLKNKWGNLIYTEEGESIYPSISNYNKDKWNRFVDLFNSKSHYCAGVCYLKGYNEPENAINSFNQVIQTDSYYSSAQEKIAESADMYVQQVLEEADALVANGDISGAIAKLNSINTYLENKGIATDSVQQKLDETYIAYAKTYYEKAEASFKDKDINAAIGNIEVAIELQPENTDYISKKAEYEQYLPFELYLEDNVLKTDSTDYRRKIGFNTQFMANDNSEMNYALMWSSRMEYKSDDSINAYYTLGGKYDIINGTFFIGKDSKNTEGKYWFKVYGDGKLIYESEKITGGVLPKNFSVNVTGVCNLKISFFGIGDHGYSTYSCGINDLIAQKEFPN